MFLEVACEAVARGSCLELDYQSGFVIFEAHAVGFDHEHHPAVLGWEHQSPADWQHGKWSLLRLDECSNVSVSGYFSEAPRPGWARSDRRFEEIICEA